jgi:hypothetical protein
VTDPTTGDPTPQTDPTTPDAPDPAADGQPRPPAGSDGVVRRPHPTVGPTNPNKQPPVTYPGPSDSPN